MAAAVDTRFPNVPIELTQQLKRAVGTLNMLPTVAVQALQIANDPECDLGKLAGVIQRDLKLTTLILRMANSALFAPPKPIASCITPCSPSASGAAATSFSPPVSTASRKRSRLN